ncbi:hypothetical protein [Micromonospora globbae]|uniref:hypothetical protein n=1 Tax=Micromonospora globbae TaxID=1894969 RepID=UPI00341EAC9C
MTEQHESRWTLNSTGNRVMYAVAVGLVVFLIAGAAGATGAPRALAFAVVTVVAYGLATVLAAALRR